MLNAEPDHAAETARPPRPSVLHGFSRSQLDRFVPTTGLWRHQDFLRLWAADSVSQFGSQVTAVALPLIAALSLHATSTQMGFLAATWNAPFLLVGLFAGVWVDRLRRRRILIAADLGRAALLLAIPIAAVLDALHIWLLYAVAVSAGVLTVFFDVAYLAFLPSLVGRDSLIEGNSKLGVSASVAQVGGPGLAGALISLLTAPFAVLIDAGSFLASALLLARIRTAEPVPVPVLGSAPSAAAGTRRTWAEIGEGLKVVGGQPILRALAGCSATTNLFGYAFLAIYVLYMTRDLGLGPAGVGLVFATGGFGALIGSVLAAPVARRVGPGPAMVGGQLLFGLGGLAIPVAVLVPSIALPLVVAAECFQWLVLLIYNVNALSVRQTLIPDRLQGRVNATMRFLTWGMQPLGSLLGGYLGGVIGLPWTLVVGVAGMLLAVLWLLFSPVRGLRQQPAIADGRAAAPRP